MKAVGSTNQFAESIVRGKNEEEFGHLSSGRKMANPAHAPSAAMSIGLHIVRRWRGASDVHRCAAD
jgi:hypothetical protein